MRTREFERLLKPIRDKAAAMEQEVQALLADKNLTDDQQDMADSLVENLLDAAMGHG